MSGAKGASTSIAVGLRTARRGRLIGPHLRLLAIGLAIAPSAVAGEDAGAEVQLIAPLDESRGYCLDLVGYQARARTDRPLQAHTCYGYRGAAGVDQAVDRNSAHSGRFRFVGFDVCMTADRFDAGDPLTLRACDDGPAQRFRWSAAGEIQPETAPALCVTVGIEPGTPGGGGQPVHLRRSLALAPCSDAAAVRQRWRLR